MVFYAILPTVFIELSVIRSRHTENNIYSQTHKQRNAIQNHDFWLNMIEIIFGIGKSFVFFVVCEIVDIKKNHLFYEQQNTCYRICFPIAIK